MKLKIFNVLTVLILSPLSILRAGENASGDDDFEARLKKAREVPKMEKNSKGGGYIGAGVGIGQTYSADSSSVPGISFLAHLQPGYIVQNNSWDRFELALDVFFGSLNVGGDSKYAVPVFGVTPKFGYGYTLGGGIFGVLNVFGGGVNGRLDGKVFDATLKSDSVWGVIYGVGYDLVFDVSDRFEFVGGLSIAHYQFNFSGVKVNDVTRDSVTANLNVPQLTLGARLKF